MTLKEIAMEYRRSEEMLKERIKTLRAQQRNTEDPGRREALERRIDHLRSMARDTTGVAVLCERYYERGYHRSERYTL